MSLYAIFFVKMCLFQGSHQMCNPDASIAICELSPEMVLGPVPCWKKERPRNAKNKWTNKPTNLKTGHMAKYMQVITIYIFCSDMF